MLKKLVLSGVWLIWAFPLFAGDTVPKKVRSFIADAEACEHFAGEFDGGLEQKRKEEIIRAIDVHCGRAQVQLKSLRQRYRNDSRILRLIERHANEAVVSYR